MTSNENWKFYVSCQKIYKNYYDNLVLQNWAKSPQNDEKAWQQQNMRSRMREDDDGLAGFCVPLDTSYVTLEAIDWQLKTNKILVLTKTNIQLHNPGLVAFYDIWPGNGAGAGL